MYSSLILAGLVAVVSALPNPNGSPSTSTCKNLKSYDANFDDLTAIPGVGFTPIGTYKGLYFQGFNLLPVAQTNLAPGVIPHSAPNYAISGDVATTLQGSAEWTTNYQASTVQSFTPQSFYYGCVLDVGEGVTALPVACNIAITGYQSGDVTSSAVEVASQTFSYNPTTNTGVQQQVKGVFSSAFANVQYVLIQYTANGGQSASSAALVLLVDDVTYTTCSL